MKTTYQQNQAFKAYQKAKTRQPEWQWGLLDQEDRETQENESLRHDLAFLGLSNFAHVSEHYY